MTTTLSARGLQKSFGDVQALAGLDLSVEEGRCLGLLGPNGAGKTTTIEILEGLQDPDAGEVELFGKRWKDARSEIQERIGCQLQETHLPDKLKVTEVLEIFAGLYRTARPASELVTLLDLGEKTGAFVKDLSGGQRQRLALGCALIHSPTLLFLDEPTSGLDASGRRRVWEIVRDFKAQGGTVLLTTHYMEEAAELADDVVIIDHGRALVSGTPDELVRGLESESFVELACTGPNAEALAAAFEALPEVQSLTRDDGSFRIGARAVEKLLPRLFATVQEHGLTVIDLNVHHPTLEDVFLQLTGRGLREEVVA